MTSWRLICLLYAAGQLAAFQYAKVPYMLPGLVAHSPMGPLEQAAFLSAIGVVGAVAGTFAGALCQAVGLRRTLAWGLGLAIPGSLLPLVVDAYALLLAARVLEGLAHMAIVVAVPTLMLGACGPTDRPRVMALWSAYFSSTFILSALLVPQLLRWGDWRWLPMVHAALLLVVGLLCLRMLPRDGLGGAAPAAPAASAGPSAPRLSVHGVLLSQWRLLRQGRLLCIPATFLGYTLLFVSLVSSLPALLAATAQGRAQIAFWLPCAALAGSVLTLGLLGRGVPGHRLVQVSAIGLVLAGLGLAALPGPGLAAQSIAVLAFVLLGTLPAGTVGSIPALFRPGDPDVALVNGGLVQFGNLGNFVGAPILALVLLQLPWRGAGVYMAGGALVVLVCLGFLRRNVARQHGG